MLLRSEARLLTITGAGGSGKTRLAIEVAAELADDFGDGVFWVPLAPLRDPALVVPTIAQTVGVRAVDELRGSEVLLLLDNLEHVLPAAAELSELLAAAPNMKLLVTSRERLHVSAELEYPLEPLSDEDAIEFFVERARAVKRDVRREEAVAEICHRLDNLPLALELAASRVKVLDPPLLLDRLGVRLPVLTGGSRDAPERQQTLRATIEWSYALLEVRLQEVFRRLAVFGGSFSLEAAEQVAEADLEEIAALVDWSLLKPIGEGRFLMLETIREYARGLLDETQEAAEVHRRHVDNVLALVEEAEPQLTGPDQREWYDRLAVEQANVREALEYACDTGDGERALMLAGTIWRFWWTHAAIDEPSHWYERAFAFAGDASPTARARAIFGAAHVAESRGDAKLARTQFEESADRFRRLGEMRWLILALTHLAIALGRLGDRRRARQVYEEALELGVRSGDIRGAAVVKANIGGDLLAKGEDGEARVLVEEALEGSRAVGDVYMIAHCLGYLGILALREAVLEQAAANLREGLELFASIRDAPDSIAYVGISGAAVLALGEAHTATRLLGAADALSKDHGFEFEPLERRVFDETVPAAREALGEGFDEAWAAGAELELEAAVELALRALD